MRKEVVNKNGTEINLTFENMSTPFILNIQQMSDFESATHVHVAGQSLNY